MVTDAMDYYKKLPIPAKTVNVNTLLSRQLQGLGFRYYWATHELRKEDYDHRLSDSSRSILEIMDHVFSLCLTVLNSLKDEPNIRPVPALKLDPVLLRRKTLSLIHDIEKTVMTMNASDLENVMITFSTKKGIITYPFMYLMNGPLADTLTHVGQILSFRRSNGNPQEAGVNVFLGLKNTVL